MPPRRGCEVAVLLRPSPTLDQKFAIEFLERIQIRRPLSTVVGDSEFADQAVPVGGLWGGEAPGFAPPPVEFSYGRIRILLFESPSTLVLRPRLFSLRFRFPDGPPSSNRRIIDRIERIIESIESNSTKNQIFVRFGFSVFF